MQDSSKKGVVIREGAPSSLKLALIVILIAHVFFYYSLKKNLGI